MCTSWKLQRLMAELTQKQAARATGISVRRYSQIERGIIKLNPKSEEYDRLARAMPIKRINAQPAPPKRGRNRTGAA
jgi:transcriptional regulator with XRE-family HTH domain